MKKDHNKKASKLFYRKSFDGKEYLLFDPSNSNDKYDRPYSINYFKPSWDVSKIVIGLTQNDAEFSTLGILHIPTLKLHLTGLSNTWPSELGGVQWLSDNSGFVYQYIPVIDKSSDDYI